MVSLGRVVFPEGVVPDMFHCMWYYRYQWCEVRDCITGWFLLPHRKLTNFCAVGGFHGRTYFKLPFCFFTSIPSWMSINLSTSTEAFQRLIHQNTVRSLDLEGHQSRAKGHLALGGRKTSEKCDSLPFSTRAGLCQVYPRFDNMSLLLNIAIFVIVYTLFTPRRLFSLSCYCWVNLHCNFLVYQISVMILPLRYTSRRY